MTKELTKWYNKYHNDYCCDDFLRTFNNPKNMNMAFILLVGDVKLYRDCHAQYLWRFSKNHPSRDEILKRINATQLWGASISHLKTFEELYDFVRKQLNNPKIPQIDQLIIYDIALRLACIKDREFLPKDYVYVHALPLKAWKNLVLNGIITGIRVVDGKIPYSKISSHFPGLSACEIEDLFCDLGKSMRRVKYGRTTMDSNKIAIDAIVKNHIKIIKYI